MFDVCAVLITLDLMAWTRFGFFPWFAYAYTRVPCTTAGEANAGDPSSYACRFPAMIADWRMKFKLPELSFLFVQLAAELCCGDYSIIRQAQLAALKLPRTGFATAIDLGDPTGPFGDIHPRRKQEVGRRLSLVMLDVQVKYACFIL